MRRAARDIMERLNELGPHDWGQVDPSFESEVYDIIRSIIHPSPWVSVEERLPDDGSWVAARLEGGSWIRAFCLSCKWYRDSGWFIEYTTITHWMPLPPL